MESEKFFKVTVTIEGRLNNTNIVADEIFICFIKHQYDGSEFSPLSLLKVLKLKNFRLSMITISLTEHSAIGGIVNTLLSYRLVNHYGDTKIAAYGTNYDFDNTNIEPIPAAKFIKEYGANLYKKAFEFYIAELHK